MTSCNNAAEIGKELAKADDKRNKDRFDGPFWSCRSYFSASAGRTRTATDPKPALGSELLATASFIGSSGLWCWAATPAGHPDSSALADLEALS